MTLETAAHVGPDGRLAIKLPSQFANTDVLLTVRPANGAAAELDAGSPISNSTPGLEETHNFVRQFAGRWEGERLIRPDQGELEVRDELR